uniref:Uncharacterized protein n=1 Tax=Tanacetum cinerariifolium TaxID=118510 RepID=A0A699H6N3_TANCI|nr:hypothetical protein [Tanacetum cinerariifolium]
MSTPVFVDPEISIHANGAQSPRVRVPFPKDPYEAIRQAYLVETKTPESPHTVASPTPLPDSTTPARHAEESEDFDTPRMAVRVMPAMSPSLSASIAKVAAMSDSVFLKRFRSSYESSPSSSPPDLPSRKHYRGTSELVEDDKEEDDKEEDEEIEGSLDFDSESEDAEDEGPTTEDEDPAAGDDGFAVRDEGLGMRVERLDLGGDAAVLEAPSIVHLPVSSPMISLTVPMPVASPATAETAGFLTDLGARVKMQEGLIRDHMVRLGELSPALFERSLKHEQEKIVVTFRAIWRLVLALESWEGQTDAQRVARWHAISDTQMENQELRLQIVEERRARLDLAEIVDSMRRGQEPRGDV